jgi:hypothetical protein
MKFNLRGFSAGTPSFKSNKSKPAQKTERVDTNSILSTSSHKQSAKKQKRIGISSGKLKKKQHLTNSSFHGSRDFNNLVLDRKSSTSAKKPVASNVFDTLKKVTRKLDFEKCESDKFTSPVKKNLRKKTEKLVENKENFISLLEDSPNFNSPPKSKGSMAKYFKNEKLQNQINFSFCRG